MNIYEKYNIIFFKITFINFSSYNILFTLFNIKNDNIELIIIFPKFTPIVLSCIIASIDIIIIPFDVSIYLFQKYPFLIYIYQTLI